MLLKEQITKHAIEVLKAYYKGDCPSCGFTYREPPEEHAENCYDLRSDVLETLDRKDTK